MANEVEDCQHWLVRTLAKPTSELLEEDGGGFRRSEKEHRVDVGNVYALVEEVDGEDSVDLTELEKAECRSALFLARVCRDGPGRDPGLVELPCHVLGVVD